MLLHACCAALLLLSAAAESAAAPELTPVISTKYGELRGSYRTIESYGGLRVAQYLGVPYATPPVGANRFSPTRTLSQWLGVHSATSFGPACPQRLPDPEDPSLPVARRRLLRHYMGALRRQSEDCLYLNIYVPQQGKSRNLTQTIIVVKYRDCCKSQQDKRQQNITSNNST